MTDVSLFCLEVSRVVHMDMYYIKTCVQLACLFDPQNFWLNYLKVS